MICDLCKLDKPDLSPFAKDSATLMICPACREKESAEPSCRCKEPIGKSNTEILKMVVRDMLPRKK